MKIIRGVNSVALSCFTLFFFFSSQVFDNQAVTVMVDGEPYTIRLFDAAGMITLFVKHCQHLARTDPDISKYISIFCRSGSIKTLILSPNRCLPSLFLSCLSVLL